VAELGQGDSAIHSLWMFHYVRGCKVYSLASRDKDRVMVSKICKARRSSVLRSASRGPLASVLALFAFVVHIMCAPQLALAEEATLTIEGTMTIALQGGGSGGGSSSIAATGDASMWLILGAAVLIAGAVYVFIKSRSQAMRAGTSISSGNTVTGANAGTHADFNSYVKKAIIVAIITTLIACTCFGMFVSKSVAFANGTFNNISGSSTVVVDNNGNVVSNAITVVNDGDEAVVIKNIQAPTDLSDWNADISDKTIEPGTVAEGAWDGKTIPAAVLEQVKNNNGHFELGFKVNVTHAETVVAFAVYSDDGQFNFYKRSDVPNVGDTIDGQTVADVYTNIEKDTYSYDSIPWESHQESITSVKVVDQGIAPVSTAYWFRNCTALSSVDVSKLNTSKTTDMFSMFQDCSNLTKLDLSSFDVSSVTNIGYMFAGCSSLESIKGLSDWKTGKIENMNGLFHGCKNLVELNLSTWDVSNVTGAISMFCNCEKLTSVGDISKWKIGKVDDMTVMFSGCSSLTSLDLSSWDTSSLTDVGAMFEDCANLVSVDLSGWKTGGIKNMSSMFSGCNAITSIGNVEKWDTSSVRFFHDMFNECKKLESIAGLSEWKTDNAEYMQEMFKNCESLTVDCSKWNVEKVKEANHADFSTGAKAVTEPSWAKKVAAAAAA
jgi:surface protein